jgi:anti-anti-sigma regulatory factor
MTTPPAKLLVFAHDRLVCIKIVGRANVGSSIDFKRLVNELMEKDLTCFVLDLSECLLMDSTFLGVLAGFGLKISLPQTGKVKDRSIELLNPNERIAELLENLGVLHLFHHSEREAGALQNGSGRVIPTGDQPTREQVTSNCLEAHQILMSLCPENAAKFKDVAQFLTEDLKKLRAGSI